MIKTSNQSALALLLLRWTPGLVFLTEGIQKFLFWDSLGAGRFAKLGFSHPSFWASFTAGFEIACGSLLVIGWLTRSATIPLLVIMCIAFITTKWPEWMEKGFWVFAHDYRTDFAMTLTLLAVLLLGAGNWSLDAKRRRI
ncbi:MAG TPA: DoxX family protein [Puia sp.]|uniref:DoxX family protein n=1 Tax=Puia sp. TaxID=2045100 RepID=UPI002BA23305|nr:DoxX family protein [Puia sp.]HVU94372.1 DoxX family protein [Puia sp.]